MLLNKMYLTVTRDGVLSRRNFLSTTAAAGFGMLTWRDAVAADALTLRKNGMACILLFMDGGPSQFETFDPKPGMRTGGPTKTISTAVPGIHIAHGWEKVAKSMKDIALVRNMTSRDANHATAQYLLRTGYRSGATKFPHFGSVVANELGDPAFDLPNFVTIGGVPAAGAGYLSKKVAPYLVGDPESLPLNTELTNGMTERTLTRRIDLLGRLEKDFADAGAKKLVADNKALTDTAAKMILSPRLKAFDIDQEKAATRDRYGRTPFGQGCLLARRLVEAGVTFVEVMLSGWDTHRENFDGVAKNAAIVDPAFSALIQDLKERGRLDKTLVIWTGEFGRTPTINGFNGRDHYSRAFTIALAGGGIKGGQVIGATDREGLEVVGKPTTVPDIFATFCKSLHINPNKSNETEGRPLKIVDNGTPVDALFG